MEKVIRELAYELWEHAGQAGGSKRLILVRSEIRIRTQGGDGRDTGGRACSLACGAASS